MPSTAWNSTGRICRPRRQAKKNDARVGNPTTGPGVARRSARDQGRAVGKDGFRAGNGECSMVWLQLAAVSLALAIGSTVLAVSVQASERHG